MIHLMEISNEAIDNVPNAPIVELDDVKCRCVCSSCVCTTCENNTASTSNILQRIQENVLRILYACCGRSVP